MPWSSPRFGGSVGDVYLSSRGLECLDRSGNSQLRPGFITAAYVNCTTPIATRWHHQIINLHAVADPTLGGIVGYVNLVWRGVEYRSSCSKGQFRYVLFGFILQPLSMELYLTAFAFIYWLECIVIVPGLEMIEPGGNSPLMFRERHTSDNQLQSGVHSEVRCICCGTSMG